MWRATVFSLMTSVFRDLTVGLARRDELQHLHLAAGERRARLAGGWREQRVDTSHVGFGAELGERLAGGAKVHRCGVLIAEFAARERDEHPGCAPPHTPRRGRTTWSTLRAGG